MRPSPHPEPVPGLACAVLPLIYLTQTWQRIHQTRHPVLLFGKSGKNRFDAPSQEYGVIYMASDPQGAFIETFGSETGVHLVSIAELDLRSLSQLTTNRPLKLVDLTSSGLARLGADGRLCTGEHPLAQRWAYAFWQHPSHIDGIYYRARHDLSQPCAAIFERAQTCLQTCQTQGLGERRFSQKLAAILEVYQFGLIS